MHVIVVWQQVPTEPVSNACAQVLSEEFSYASGALRRFRFLQYLASLLGFALVALLQLIHDGD